VHAPGGNAMSWHSRGLSTRTHGVRPSEKTPFDAIPGLANQSPLPSVGRLAEGRAPHARKEGPGLTETYPPWATGFSPAHAGGNEIPRHTFGHAKRTHRVRPSEKTAFDAIPGLANQAPLPPLGLAAKGRAPHARKESSGLIEACPRWATGFSPILAH
jgi:hypothetical protein